MMGIAGEVHRFRDRQFPPLPFTGVISSLPGTAMLTIWPIDRLGNVIERADLTVSSDGSHPWQSGALGA